MTILKHIWSKTLKLFYIPCFNKIKVLLFQPLAFSHELNVLIGPYYLISLISVKLTYFFIILMHLL